MKFFIYVLVFFISLNVIGETNLKKRVDALIKGHAYKGFDLYNKEYMTSKRDLWALGYSSFPTLKKLYYENTDDFQYQAAIITVLTAVDNQNVLSAGERDGMQCVRDYVRRWPQKPLAAAMWYLATKGTQQDLKLLEQYVPSVTTDYSRVNLSLSMKVLVARLAGTNIIKEFQGCSLGNYSSSSPCFVPSVANTGPQAAVAFEHIKAELEKVGGDVSKLSPEVLTYVAPRPKSISPCSWIIYLTPVGVLLVLWAGVVYWRKRRKR